MAEGRILIDHKKIESRRGYHFVKRISDVVLSAIGLIVFSPLMIMIAYKLKLESTKTSRSCVSFGFSQPKLDF